MGNTATQLNLSHASDDRGEGRRVIQAEAQALNELAVSLDKSFEAAIDILFQTAGRVILSGIGKSGHIANKIASTFSSTGTPAFFVHPSEASHGDLGMLTREDVLIVLSFSGKTAELSDLLGYAKRFGIALIAITQKAESTLGKAAQITLLLPPCPEACPMGLAPTTSTTMMLALGDALALALLKRRNFSEHDFKDRHPGGLLGRKLLCVSDVMRTAAELPLLPPGTLMSDALVEMSANGFGCSGIMAPDGRLAGIITDGDLRRHMNPALLEQKVEDVMTPSPHTISADLLALEAVRIMNEKGITHLFVLEKDKPVGLLRLHDCLRAGVV